jgi:hypothetical protein
VESRLVLLLLPRRPDAQEWVAAQAVKILEGKAAAVAAGIRRRAAEDLPNEIVHAGFSLGVLPAQMLAQTRPGAKGALLFHACVPPSEFGCPWPRGVPVQIHAMDADEFCRGQGRSVPTGAEPYRVSVSFGRITQNSFPSGSASTVQDSAPVCPMSTRRAPSARSRSISWARSCAMLVRSRCMRFLTVFGSVTGIKHMPTGAFSSVPMTISRSRSERIFQPSACVQNRASPGRS